MFTAQLTGLDEAIASLEREVAREVPQGLRRGAEAVAAVARADHTFQNRTGNLEASIRVEDQGVTPADVGDEHLSVDDELAVNVVAEMEYASYVNDNPDYAFLEPAFETAERAAEFELDEALQQAADQAGWKR